MPRPNPERIYEYRNYRYTYKTTPTGPVTDSYPTATLTVEDRSYTSTNTPGFPDVAVLPFNNHQVRWRRRTYGNLQYDRTKWDGTYTRYTNVPSTVLAVSQEAIETHAGNTTVMWSSNAHARARSKVIGNIQRLKSNVAQNIAEYRQVQNMFSTNVRRITNAYRALRHGDVSGFSRNIPLRKRHKQDLLRRGPFDVRRNAPTIWLETQYGWLPLLGDVYTGITNFYKRVEEGYTIRAKGSGVDTFVTSGGWVNDPGIVRHRDTTRKKIYCQYIIDYEVDFARLVNMQSWGLTNPLLLAWELVPYSFVVDWFLPVGDWLSQIGYSTGLYFKRGMRSAMIVADTVRTFGPQPTTANETRKLTGTDWYRSVAFNREKLGSFPSPGVPRLDPLGLRGRRIANALSLLALAFDRPLSRKR